MIGGYDGRCQLAGLDIFCHRVRTPQSFSVWSPVLEAGPLKVLYTLQVAKEIHKGPPEMTLQVAQVPSPSARCLWHAPPFQKPAAAAVLTTKDQAARAIFKGGDLPCMFQLDTFLFAPSFLIFMLLPSGHTLNPHLLLQWAHAWAHVCTCSSCWVCWRGSWGSWWKQSLLVLLVIIVIALFWPLACAYISVATFVYNVDNWCHKKWHLDPSIPSQAPGTIVEEGFM